MLLANCRRCGKLFNRIGQDLCPDCIREEEEKINEIREYLRHHPRANIYEVSQKTSATYDEIVDLIRTGKLMLRQYPNVVYPCDKCGSPTQTGRLCMNCEQELMSEFKVRTKGNDLYKANHEKSNKGFYSRG